MDQTVLNDVFASLDIMWKGMLGLFIVCGGVAILMILIARFIRKPKS